MNGGNLMNELSNYISKEFGNVRGVLVNEIPYLVGKDICIILGYSNPSDAIKTHVDDDDKILVNSKTQSDFAIEFNLKELGQRGGWLINESGFYSLVFGSELKTAKRFKKWVTSDVLPKIRRTGGYIPVDEGDSEKDILAKALLIANKTISELQQFYDDLMNTEGLYHMNTVAKELRIGRNTLFAYLRGKDIMFYQDNANVPYQRFMNQGLFKVVESPCADGKYRPTTYATKKGLDYIRKLLHKDGYYDTEVA